MCRGVCKMSERLHEAGVAFFPSLLAKTHVLAHINRVAINQSHHTVFRITYRASERY